MDQEKHGEMEIIEERNRLIVRVGNSKLVMTKDGITLTVPQKTHPRSA